MFQWSRTQIIYRSPTISLTNDWSVHFSPFTQIKMPEWADRPAPLDIRALTEIASPVRTVRSEGGNAGESLLPYDIHIDDVGFID